MAPVIRELEEDIIVAVGACIILNKRKKKRRNRRWHIHPIYQRRRQYGAYHTLVKELEFEKKKENIREEILRPFPN